MLNLKFDIMFRRNKLFILIAAFLTCFMAILQARAQGRQEFTGPFSSWADVKKKFGAHGNGRDDDTRALQDAIDGLACPPTGYRTDKDGYMVLYLQAGTY